MSRFAPARSLHASLDLRAPRPAGAAGEALDSMAQDRYGMQTLEATQVARGDTMYKQARGQLIAIPSAAETQRIWRDFIKGQESGGR